MKQTGNIPCYPHPEDYVMGAETAIAQIDRIQNADWTAHLPSTEKQYGISFDTLSCTSFSLCSTAETNVNWLISTKNLPQSTIDWLQEKGYMDDYNKVNFSDRFIAIMSGTKKTGNDLRTVVETARKVGFIPDIMFSFAGNNWEEYHNKALITQEMLNVGQEFLKLIDIKWEWVFFDQDPKMSDENYSSAMKALKQSPLQIGIPTPATHATMLYGITPNKRAKVFDTYDPFFFENFVDDYQMHFAMKIVLSPKEQPKPVLYPQHQFTKTLKYGMTKNVDVVKLQEVLIAEKLLAVGLNTGNFFDKTLSAVKNFQAKYGIETVGQVGQKTRAKLNELCSKKG